MMDIKEHQQVWYIVYLYSVNEQLAEELHKPVTKKFKRRKVYARFKDNFQAAVLTEMGSLPSKNKNDKYLPSVVDVFTKYV